MKIRLSYCLFFLFTLFITSCSVTKFVPEGEHLLDKVEFKSDKKDFDKKEFEKYVRQMPNSSVFGIWRMQLRIYSLAGKDTTKWLNRALIRAGEAPVIYSQGQTYLSEQHLKKALENKGYMHASVSSRVSFGKDKAAVTYILKENDPYRLRDYNIDLPNEALKDAATDSTATLVRKNMLFDVDVLDAERDRISKDMRTQGYYKFNKEFLTYVADSAFHNNRVDVTMQLREFDNIDIQDSIQQVIFTPYHIRNVVFFTSKNVGSMQNQNDRNNYERIQEGNYILVSDKEKFLKLNTLIENTFIEPGELYSDVNLERTYTALNALAPVKYVNIFFREVQGKDSLDCFVTVASSKLVSLSAELEATYTDGFWGVATNIGTVHRNVFKGAESLSLQGRLAYEWQKDVLARELGAQAKLLFPNFLMPFTSREFRKKIRANTEFSAGVNYQFRPSEFEVMNVNSGVKYGWTQSRFRHTFELLDISYVDFEVTPEFRDSFLVTNKFNSYNYEDHVITRIGYIGAYSTYNPKMPLKNHVSLRYGIETAGNLLYGINSIFGGKKNDDGFYSVINIPYSQYVRGDFNVTYHQIIDSNNRFVYHLGMGAGTPYGNANIIPYERRFLSGGANSVRGWSEGTLGPGAYERNTGIRGRDYNQAGDIKLDINMEYRFKMFRALDGALFIDGGNIWTVRDYETQKGGQFKFSTFLDQIALAYGGGLRLDLSFVIIRLDLGVKLHDPALPRSDRWRSKLTSNDFALHFAIGYPF